MGYIVSELLKLMEKELGVTENPLGSNKQKFSRFFDIEAWQFFNTKKNPCYWCSVYVIWTLVQVLTPILGSYDAVRKWLGMPTPKNNEAAGVGFIVATMFVIVGADYINVISAIFLIIAGISSLFRK